MNKDDDVTEDINVGAEDYNVILDDNIDKYNNACEDGDIDFEVYDIDEVNEDGNIDEEDNANKDVVISEDDSIYEDNYVNEDVIINEDVDKLVRDYEKLVIYFPSNML